MTPVDLARLHAAAFETERPWTAAEFQELLAQRHTHLTHLPGGFALWRSVAGEAELLTIAVDPQRRRQGIGHALMRTWMGAASRDADTAFLEVAADNRAACTLYAHHGFETVATRPGYYARAASLADALVMQALLSGPAQPAHA